MYITSRISSRQKRRDASAWDARFPLLITNFSLCQFPAVSASGKLLLEEESENGNTYDKADVGVDLELQRRLRCWRRSLSRSLVGGGWRTRQRPGLADDDQ